MSNFFGFPKPRKAGFGSADIPSGDAPLDTTDEDVVLEGVIVDFGEAGPRVNLDDIDSHPGFLDPFSFEPGVLDPFLKVGSRVEGEDIDSFLRRMMGITYISPDTQGDVSGTILVDDESSDNTDAPRAETEIPVPTVESAESVEDMLKVMGNQNEKLQNFITDAMKNIKK